MHIGNFSGINSLQLNQSTLIFNGQHTSEVLCVFPADRNAKAEDGKIFVILLAYPNALLVVFLLAGVHRLRAIANKPKPTVSESRCDQTSPSLTILF